MAEQVPGERDYDSMYGGGDGLPPWSIGETQPEIAALVRQGAVAGSVLDAGCGHAEVGLELAVSGHDVVGLDISPRAIAAATAAAAERGLSTKAKFSVADISDFGGFDNRFDTVIDSALFHALPKARWDAYQQCVFRAAAPGARYYVLTFAPEAFSWLPCGAPRPNAPTVDELHGTVSPYWEIDEITPAFVHGNSPSGSTVPGFEMPFADLPFDRDEKGRSKFPAWLLAARVR
ncbi:class I SAM-dependent methyltransferase [Mycobacteroides chelonae]|nr:class I SAM-dependent methyltransferase [Mycobacteroides chelonae]MBV0920448.1 class I SAM-dependent methyltransferase [Mycobacteroides chelonae]